MRWKLSSINPAGKGSLAFAKIGDKVVGTVSLSKKKVLIDGVEVIVGVIGDTYSSAEIRRFARESDIGR